MILFLLSKVGFPFILPLKQACHAGYMRIPFLMQLHQYAKPSHLEI